MDEYDRILVGGPRDGHQDTGSPWPRLRTVEFEGTATYARGRLVEGAPARYVFQSIEPHPEPLATSMRLFARGLAPPF